MFGGNILSSDGKIVNMQNSDDLSVENLRSAEMSSFWYADNQNGKPELQILFDKTEVFDKIVLSENIADGQHIESFEIFALNDRSKWKSIYQGSTVGYKRICDIKPIRTTGLKIVFSDFRDFLELSHIRIN